jgi:AraC-like DNA-binding protein
MRLNRMAGTSSEPQKRRMRADLDELAARIARVVPSDGQAEPQRGMIFNRASAPSQQLHGFMDPSFCVIARGRKRILFGEYRLTYDPAHYLITTVGIPAIGQIVDASGAHPYLAFRLILEPAIVTSAMLDSGQVQSRGNGVVKAANVSSLDASLLDATLRLVRLLDTPVEFRTIAPLVIREIVYRLLRGMEAGRMRQLATFGGHAHRIARAIEQLRKSLSKPMRVEEIAANVGMSTSAFHAHFKAVTAMSPLQFQKHLRLQEARRLLLNEHLDAAEAGYRVGYDDQSYFSREYKRHFGEPPIRDVQRLREPARS